MLDKDKNESLGQYIVRIRENKGYSQRKLAQITGLSNTTINRIEKGETLNPDINTLKTLANHLNIDETYILEIAGYLDAPSNTEDTNKENDKVTTIATHRVNYGEDLPEEARKQLDDYLQFLREKYGKKTNDK